MSPLASLPMYDLPEVLPHTDAIWGSISAGLRKVGIDAPEQLTRELLPPLKDHWLSPSTLLSHTCGYPVVNELDGRVDVIGSWSTVVDVPDKPGWYRTVIVAREDDQRADDLRTYSRNGLRLCANGPESLSGWISFAQFLHDQQRLTDDLLINEVPVLITGAHISSLEAIRTGRADLASIDSWSYWLFSTWRRDVTAGLRVIGYGPEVAVTPLITSLGGPVEPMRNALAETVGERQLQASLAAVGITGFVPHGIEAHDPVREIAARCESAVGLLRREPW